MRRLLFLAAFAAAPIPAPAEAQQRAQYEKLVATHAKANDVPEVLVHRVIVRESKYQPELIGHGGTIGLMQIKLGTARGLGYKGDAVGLRDPETNLTYGVKYLAGAYRAANRDHDRAVRYYARGYYYEAKRQRLEQLKHPEPVLTSASKGAEPVKDAAAEAKQTDTEPVDAASPVADAPGVKPATRQKQATGRPMNLLQHMARKPSKKLAGAKVAAPRPPAVVPRSASAAPVPEK